MLSEIPADVAHEEKADGAWTQPMLKVAKAATVAKRGRIDNVTIWPNTSAAAAVP